jgi:type II secretory pathway predicted ATPase ExeA
MHTKQSRLGDHAFGQNADAIVTVSYKSNQNAIKFLQSVLKEQQSVGLLQGPDACGKSTILRQLSEKLPGDAAVAVIDGNRIKPRELLSEILSQFGYDTGLAEVDELLNMIEVLAVQQTNSCEPPVIFIDNVDRMYPSALKTLDKLAGLTSKQRFVIRLILTGHEGLSSLIESDGMRNIAERSADIFSIEPLTAKETRLYLHARLRACGVKQAGKMLTAAVCDRLYKKSGGWPGLLNQIARDTIRPEPPRFVVTKNGKTVAEFPFQEKKMLLGRSEFCDIVVDDDFVSKVHIALLLYADAMVLLDLNSANGTIVNSRQVKSTILKEDDIISLGDHRIKVLNVPAMNDEVVKLLKSPDTVNMTNLIDMRRLKAERCVRAVPSGKKHA